MNKPTLLLISDLRGNSNAEYLLKYESFLESRFTVCKIDVCQLAEIHNSHEVDKNHSAFINEGGLTRAVKNLQEQYKGSVDFIIGFSIGGTVAWQACLQNLSVRRLICISATRLRKETQKPNCKIEVYFGKNDSHRPSENWKLLSSLESKIIAEVGHEFYKEDDFIKSFSLEFINETPTHQLA
jgi:predicted esterase